MAIAESQMSVVMVDDDAEDIFLTRILLRRACICANFTGVNSGQELYDYIKNNGVGSIDVILLDINMPIESGFDVLRKLMAYPDIDDLKIIMYSTSNRPEETVMALELGADGFVEKPRRLEDMANLSEAIFAANQNAESLHNYG